MNSVAVVLFFFSIRTKVGICIEDTEIESKKADIFANVEKPLHPLHHSQFSYTERAEMELF